MSKTRSQKVKRFVGAVGLFAKVVEYHLSTTAGPEGVAEIRAASEDLTAATLDLGDVLIEDGDPISGPVEVGRAWK